MKIKSQTFQRRSVRGLNWRGLVEQGVRLLYLIVAAAILAACSTPAAPAPTTAPAAAPTAAPAAVKPAGKPNRPLKIDLATVNAPPLSSAVAMKWFADEVTKRTNGDITINYHGATLLTKELEIVNAVKSGSIAIGSAEGATTTIFPELEALLVPYLFRDYDHAYKVFYGDIGKELVKGIESKHGLKPLIFYDNGFRSFVTVKKPIRTIDDLKGMKMRVMQGATFADTVNAFGASAVPMGWAETLPAAQQGVIDGFDLATANVILTKSYEVVKYFTMSRHNLAPAITVMNLGVWQSLTMDEQKLFEDVARGAGELNRKMFEDYDKNAKSTLAEKGMEFIDLDRAPFGKIASEKVWPKYKATSGDLFDRIAAVK